MFITDLKQLKLYKIWNFSQLTEQFRTQVTEKLENVKQGSGDEGGSLQQHLDKVQF